MTYPSEDYVVHDSKLKASKDKDSDIELASLVEALLLLMKVVQEVLSSSFIRFELKFFPGKLS